MFNERLCLVWRRMKANRPVQRGQDRVPTPNQRHVMTGGIAAFIAAVGGTSLVCYWLMNRAENRSTRRQGASGDSADSSGSFTGGYGGEGWNVASWFSSSRSSSDNSDSSGASGDWGGLDSSGGDSSGGGDSGGGGDGGGGGD